ncbi:MAG TPA: glycerol-3-phosphate 1-O-acyltransferase PlsY [Dissulfurispiraceae bacterium]|nr:glycerol-3-phosphate 1-O-acyltransferase PlsY [Dissulfurispiraceae bacterium]
MTILSAIVFIAAYAIGSIPTGLLIARSRGVDLRSVGSGNIGATNVLRALGKEAAILTLLGDMAKGAIAVAIARAAGIGPLLEGLAGLTAILGHNFSVFLRFRGGKGVATSLGVLAVLSPPVTLFTITLWLVTLKWSRISSLAALVSFGFLPFSFYMIDYSQEKMAIAAAITILVFLRHIPNIRRLIQGTESRIGEKR